MTKEQIKKLEYLMDEFQTTEETFYEAQLILSNEFIPIIKKHWDSFSRSEQELLNSMTGVTDHLKDLKKHNEFMSTLASLRAAILNDAPNAAISIVNFITQINEKYPYLQNSAMLYSKINTFFAKKIEANPSLEKDLAEKYNELKKINQLWLTTKKTELNVLFKDDIENDIEFTKKRDEFLNQNCLSPNEFISNFDKTFTDEMQQQEFKTQRDELFKTENQYQNTGGFSFSDLFITRIQRGPRYSMLLGEIVKNITGNDLLGLVENSISIVKDQNMIANCNTSIENGNDALKLLLNRKSTLAIQTLAHLTMEQMVRANIDALIKNKKKEPSETAIEDYLSKSRNFNRMQVAHKKELDNLDKQINETKALEEPHTKLQIKITDLEEKRSKIVQEQLAAIKNEKLLAAQALKLKEHIVKFKDGKDTGYEHIKATYLDHDKNASELKSLPGKIQDVENEIMELSLKIQTEINEELAKIVSLTDKIKEENLDPNTMTQETKENLAQLMILCSDLEKKDTYYKKAKYFPEIKTYIKSILDAIQEKIKCEQNIITTVSHLNKQSKALAPIKTVDSEKNLTRNILHQKKGQTSKLQQTSMVKEPEEVSIQISTTKDITQEEKNMNLLNAAASGNLELLKEALKAGANINTIGGESSGFCNAIQLAILYGRTEVIPFMLEANADLKYNKNQFGLSAVELANNSELIIEIIKKHLNKSPRQTF